MQQSTSRTDRKEIIKQENFAGLHKIEMYLHKRRVIDRRIQKTSGVNEEDVAEQMRAGTKERCSFLVSLRIKINERVVARTHTHPNPSRKLSNCSQETAAFSSKLPSAASAVLDVLKRDHPARLDSWSVRGRNKTRREFCKMP